jgi:hypothetical protein
MKGQIRLEDPDLFPVIERAFAPCEFVQLAPLGDDAILLEGLDDASVVASRLEIGGESLDVDISEGGSLTLSRKRLTHVMAAAGRQDAPVVEWMIDGNVLESTAEAQDTRTKSTLIDHPGDRQKVPNFELAEMEFDFELGAPERLRSVFSFFDDLAGQTEDSDIAFQSDGEDLILEEKTKREQFWLKDGGEGGSVRLLIGRSDLDYITKPVARGAGPFDTVQIRIQNEQPLLVTYRWEEGELSYFVAPRFD